jgi:hypothetical protein
MEINLVIVRRTASSILLHLRIRSLLFFWKGNICYLLQTIINSCESWINCLQRSTKDRTTCEHESWACKWSVRKHKPLPELFYARVVAIIAWAARPTLRRVLWLLSLDLATLASHELDGTMDLHDEMEISVLGMCDIALDMLAI